LVGKKFGGSLGANNIIIAALTLKPCSEAQFSHKSLMAPSARTIILPVNESAESNHTVAWAARFLLRKEDRVVLLHLRPQISVFDHYVKSDGSGTAVADGKTVTPDVKVHMVQDTYAAIGEDVLHKAGQPITAEGINFETRVVESGDVKEAICAMAKELRATLIVIGGRGLGIVQRTLLGSIRRECISSYS
jgi:nucleotide-binding universal stress UspA family protein